MATHGPAIALHDPAATRSGGRDLLSLALIDARNRTLRWLGAFEAAERLRGGEDHCVAPLWLAGRAGWFQEWWISRHVQRLRGEAADPASPRLASIEPRADAWFGTCPGAPWVADDLPTAADVRSYLAATLETTLELLAAADESDVALHFWRAALLHEDRLAEAFAGAAQWLQVDPREAGAPCGAPPARVQREPLWLPARRFALGSLPGGLVPPNERWAHEEAVPEFEIDAQPVSWARFVEFAEDGGYDDERLWTRAGWQWAQAQGRRAPRGVEQLRGGVLQLRAGRMQRVAASQSAVHASWYEADAWCRWAGRRLPTELEWELAACTAASRGFVRGDVWEWAAGTARAWSGAAAAGVPPFSPLPSASTWAADPDAEPMRVLRGASSWTVPRCAHPKARRFASPARDDLFCGFRSCALLTS
jgi:formylglycine-generating enzyme required for sulfatase activity